MDLLILGDIGASASNMEAFCKGDGCSLFCGEILELCQTADTVLLNLEKPLTDKCTPLGKCPPDYIAPTDTINGIMALCPTAATLANNHILDQREQGLWSTTSVLESRGVKYVGVGKNCDDARKPLIIEAAGIKLGVYACCEREFSFATASTPGANAFDPLVTPDDITALREKCDFVLILYHGGTEHYPYPTPYLQKVCRKLCDKGADIVICQHSHIVGCQEVYGGSTIIYGQGNFLLDDVNIEIWNMGLIVRLNIEKNSPCRISLIPIRVVENKVCLADNSAEILEGFKHRSEQIKDENWVCENYRRFCEEKKDRYLLALHGTGRILRRILMRLPFLKIPDMLYSRNARNLVLDYIRCDAHREAMETLLDTGESDVSY